MYPSTVNECKPCGNRTQFALIRCGYCYSCHWKREQLEKVRLESSVVANSAFDNYSQSTLAEIKQSHHHDNHHEYQQPQQQQQQQKDY
jgi:hypothetical protein